MRNSLMTIPLSQLQPAKDNVRKTERSADIKALAASIEAHGLLQNLTVRPTPTNGRQNRRYEVIAGGRRLQALVLLAKRKRIAKDFGVPCKLLGKQSEASIEVSLAENVVRTALHPADQFEAFSQLQSKGLGAAEIAARFGVTQKVVEQRLKLAAVSPRLMAVYREGGMTLDQLTAFTISDDHAAQEHVWFEAPLSDHRPETIRRSLTKALVEGSDRRVRFIGAKAYEDAGGVVIRDLFEENAAYFADSQLLDRLVAEKLTTEAENVRQEGWSWVEIQPELDYEVLARFGRLPSIEVKLPKKERKKLQALCEKYDALVAGLEEEPDKATDAELDRLTVEIESLSCKQERWSDKNKARAGAFVSVGPQGKLQVTRGLVRQEAAKSSKRAKQAGNSKESTPEKAHPGHSAALLRDLSAHRTAALRESIASQPGPALTALVHALALRIFFDAGDETCFDVRPVCADLIPFADGIGTSPAVTAMADRHKRWLEQLAEPDQVWSWLTEQSVETRLELLAYLAACTINAVRHRVDPTAGGKLAHADTLAHAVSLDMSRWWQPTRASYLDRVSKELIARAVSEAVSPKAAQTIAGMKKAAMAVRAEELLSTTKWLPKPLCNASSVETGK
jgi:ParB family chromosome partitioning protein